jgi:hypothetical protein
MAVKKKKAKKAARPKRRPGRPGRHAKGGAVEGPVLPIDPQPQRRAGGLWPALIIAGIALALYFAFRDSSLPPAHKAAAGASIETPSAGPGPSAPPASKPEPQKRATSQAGPRVWDRKQVGWTATFKVLREKDGVAEVRIFKAGNAPVWEAKSERGPRQTVTLVWNGKNSEGKFVEPGTYYARITGAHGDMVEEILVK